MIKALAVLVFAAAAAGAFYWFRSDAPQAPSIPLAQVRGTSFDLPVKPVEPPAPKLTPVVAPEAKPEPKPVAVAVPEPKPVVVEPEAGPGAGSGSVKPAPPPVPEVKPEPDRASAHGRRDARLVPRRIAIAYAGAGNVYVVPLDGGAPTLLAEGSEPLWSPDGSHVAVTVQGGISVLAADGSNAILITNGDEAAWSPDGLHIVTNVEEPSSGGYHEELWVAAADGSGVAINILPPGCCSNGIVDDTLTWSPDGTRIAFEDGSEDRWRVVNADGTGGLGTIDELEVAAWRSA